MSVFTHELKKTAIHWLFFVLSSLLVSQWVYANESLPHPNHNTPGIHWRYSVRPGDTLIQFSKKYLSNPENWRTLQKLNQIQNPYRMLPGSIIQVPIDLLKQTIVAAEVVMVSGDVRVKLPNGSLKQAVVGEQLQIGTAISTFDKSKVDLRFADATVLSIASNSVLKLDTLSMYSGGGMVDTKLRLQRGRVDVKANPKHQHGNQFQIITPTAVAAVRGTEFRVSAEDALVRQETLKGEVLLAAGGGQVGVLAGYGSISENGQPPVDPVKLLDAPVLDEPATLFEQLPLSFQVKSGDQASSWFLQISPNERFEIIAAEKYSQLPKLVIADLADGQYVLRVLGQDQHGLQGYETTHAFRVNARPFAPLVVSPSNNALVRSQDVMLRWSGVVGVKRYLLEIAADASFEKLLIKEIVEKNVYPLTNPESKPYFWRVASIEMGVDGSVDQGPFMPIHQFTYKPLPDAPDVSQFAEFFDKDKLRIQLPVPQHGLHYEVLLTEDVECQQLLWNGQSLNGNFEIPRPVAGKKYLAVRLVESDGTAGPYALRVIDVPAQKSDWHPFMLIPFIFAL